VENDYLWYWIKRNGFTFEQIAKYVELEKSVFMDVFLHKERDPKLWQALYINYLSNNEVPMTSMTTELSRPILKQLKINLVENQKDRAVMFKKIKDLSIGKKYNSEKLEVL